MQPILRVEIIPLAEYDAVRDGFRAKVSEEKRARRVTLGEHMSGVFENRETVRLQIQEMIRMEQLTAEPAILHELETYNALVPGDGELSLTAYVDQPDKAARDRLLVDLAGLEETILLEVDGARFPFAGRRDGAVAGRTTAVHYLKARVSPEAALAIRAGTAKVAVVVDHPVYHARADLPAQTVKKLAEDLSGPS
jgi:Protein of unknown function (DUF3501)